MIELLFFILKLIGWVVLGILGVIFGILLLVLFCAVRYRLDGKKEDGFEGKLCVTWLFRIISVVLGYQEGLFARVKLFGKTIWKLDGKESGREEGIAEKDAVTGSCADEAVLILEEEKRKLEKEAKTKQEEEEAAREKAEKKEEYPKEKPVPKSRQKHPAGTKKYSRKQNPDEKKGLWERSRDRIADWIEKLRFSFSEICGKLKQMDEKRQWFLEKKDWVFRMLEDPANQASVRLLLRQMKKIFRHILPRKGLAEVTFGREDPYLMGKLLSYAGAAYPFVHKVLVLHPVFDENRLEGEVHVRGRIRLGVILCYMLRLLFNKNIRQKLKEVQNGR